MHWLSLDTNKCPGGIGSAGAKLRVYTLRSLKAVRIYTKAPMPVPLKPVSRITHHASILALCVAGLWVQVLTAGPATDAAGAKAESPLATKATAESPEQKWGIKVIGPYLSGGGNLVDFRYRVLDSKKAAPLSKKENKPSLLNPANGAKLIIPNTPKLGSLRQMTAAPVEGKVYFMLFANTQHHVKHGDKVTLTAGECKIENLIVD